MGTVTKSQAISGYSGMYINILVGYFRPRRCRQRAIFNFFIYSFTTFSEDLILKINSLQYA